MAVRAQITGELTAVKFQQGDDVQAGQELFTLDRRPLEAALQQATANLERDSATAANAKVIWSGTSSWRSAASSRASSATRRARSVAALEATLAADRAAIENAKVQLQYATIRAPIADEPARSWSTPATWCAPTIRRRSSPSIR